MVLGFPFLLGFGVLCLVGSFLSLSCGDWLGVWLGLELNLLGFVPLMVQGEGGQSVESCVKYFIIQALGSAFLLLGGLGGGGELFFWFTGGGLTFFSVLCFLGLVIKLGLVPFHWWVPSVMGGLGWFGCGFLMTWQKLAPFFVLVSFCFSFFWICVLLGSMSSVVGGFMGIGQVQVRIMMGYSSICHWGWILGLCCLSVVGSACYFFFYFFLSICIFYLLACQGSWRVGYLSGVGGIMLVFGFLSLGGLPPLTGFVPKMLGIQVICLNFSFGMLGFLLAGSVLSLYYYLSFLFICFVGEVWGGGGVSISKYLSGFSGVCLCLVCLGAVFYEFVFFLF